MFDPSSKPRVFGQHPGTNFPAAIAAGLRDRAQERPELLAEVEVFTNTRRMARQIKDALSQGPAMILPRIRLVTDISRDMALSDVKPAVSSLRRRLELSQLVAQLIDTDPSLAPRAAVFDLADSLAALMSEMHDEGVAPETIQGLTVQVDADHWERALEFVKIVERYFGSDSSEPYSEEARQRVVISRLIESWNSAPPAHPILIAGSTGSRGTTRMLMEAAARQAQGAVILPGFDFSMPQKVWDSFDRDDPAHDHPQYRYVTLLDRLDLMPGDIREFHAAGAPNESRNRLVSLAMRPAPVTDEWLAEGPGFSGLNDACDQITLLEAPTPRSEALCIALTLRAAAETGKTAALISPDRMLTRQVTAALDRWRIEPDDSAGEPLAQTPPGRLLRQVAGLFGRKLTAETLLALLKHPLVMAASSARGQHLLWTRSLELWIRKTGVPFPTPEHFAAWADGSDAAQTTWAAWVGDLLCGLQEIAPAPIPEMLARHLHITRALVAGPEGEDDSPLWARPAGQEARKFVTSVELNGPYGGVIGPLDYIELLTNTMSRHEVRDPSEPHPNIMIWGTLEARVQGADLVILGGLNDGIWPAQPTPDPWLSRAMRRDAGLLSPEQFIGLSAHDFQQAVGAREILLTRAVRDAESQTVASRWLNRLTNLLGGMSQEGREALDAMRGRGDALIAMADQVEFAAPIPPAPRPSVKPPVSARPTTLSVTQIQTLIRDPYAIYAREVLGLRALNPLRQQPDAPVRGSVFHRVFELFLREHDDFTDSAALIRIAREVLEEEAPWPTVRAFWLAQIERLADWFILTEHARRALGTPAGFEPYGRMKFPNTDFTLRGKADRIDTDESGAAIIYDYKTGSIPTKPQRLHFDRQLLLEAAMMEAGAFANLGPHPVKAVTYIGLGSTRKVDTEFVSQEDIAKTLSEVEALIQTYQSRTQGYSARRAMMLSGYDSDYDQLSRRGEWDDSTPVTPMEVGDDDE